MLPIIPAKAAPTISSLVPQSTKEIQGFLNKSNNPTAWDQVKDVEPSKEEQTKEVLRACDKALKLCVQSNKVKDEIITEQKQALELASKRVSELEETPFLRQPLVWFVFGALFTGTIAMLVNK